MQSFGNERIEFIKSFVPQRLPHGALSVQDNMAAISLPLQL